jgi:hypothetical protein
MIGSFVSARSYGCGFVCSVGVCSGVVVDKGLLIHCAMRCTESELEILSRSFRILFKVYASYVPRPRIN